MKKYKKFDEITYIQTNKIRTYSKVLTRSVKKSPARFNESLEKTAMLGQLIERRVK